MNSSPITVKKQSADNSSKQLERWKNNLIDFSKRNKLLYFKPGASSSVEFNSGTEEIFSKLILEARSLGFKAKPDAINMDDFAGDLSEGLAIPVDPDAVEPGMTFEEAFQNETSPILEDNSEDLDFSNLVLVNKDQKSLEQALVKLKTRSKSSIQEQGINILYIALYFLQWSEEDEIYKSPLILIPVNLERKGLNGAFKLSLIEDEIRINPTLAYKLMRDYAIDFSNFEEKISEIESTEQLQDLVNEFRSTISKQKNWTVVDESCLSLFSFAKLTLYRDLENNEKKILTHPIIRQISGEAVDIKLLDAGLKKEFLVTASEIDKKIDPNQIKIVLDADSSQEEAVLAAKAGLSFVIQGPPGTGKSQTISNIIADALADGKRVLFVSEKKSALDVVVKRLRDSRLDRFCLELHNPSQKKSEVILKIKNDIEEIKSIALEIDRGEYTESISILKEQIQKSIDELHRLRKPINKSLYEIYGELASIDNKMDMEHRGIDFSIPVLEKLNEQKISELDFFFNRLGTKTNIISDYDNFIWKNANVNNLSFELESSIKSNFIEFKNLLSRLGSYANPIAEKYFGRKVSCLKEFKWLAEASKLAINSPFPKRDWFNFDKISQIQTLTLQARIEHEEYRVDRSKLLSDYNEKFLELNHEELISKFTTKFSGIFRFLDFDYWQTVGQIKKLSVFNEIKNLQNLIGDFKQAALVDKKANELDKASAGLSLELGGFYKEFDTNWDETITAITWVQKVLNKLNNSELPDTLIELISSESTNDDFNDFKSQVEALLQAYELVSYHLKFYKEIFPNPNIDLDNLSFDDLADHLEKLITNIIQIEDWIEFKQIETEANTLGIKQFLDVLLYNRVKGLNTELIKSIFCRKLYQLWIDKIEIEYPELRKFSGVNQELLINKYNELDQSYLEKNKKSIVKALASRWIDLAADQANKDQLQIISQEINKKKKHKPIRLLVKETFELLKVLKPCWMMSPLSVSQFIDADSNSGFIDFDLVIFDEASQIRTEDAICSIYRGKQLILAGDSNQLPPSNFFNYVNDDEDYENLSFESVLDECSVFLNSKTLNWHYRSRHEDLIKFSNYHIYDNQLVTFPSPIAQAKDLGIEHEFIENGYYEKGSRFNRKEAQRVAEAVIEHYMSNSELSLGVIAFSEAQQMAIERELAKQIRQNINVQEKINQFLNEENPDALFIKNLENVQGDERDVIYFSIGYAKDKKGDLSHNFGPLNRDGGHRRLNVAITRARNNLKVFTSMFSSEIDLNKTSSQGALLLKKYLAFAENLKNGTCDLESKLEMNNEVLHSGEVEESIARALEVQGYTIDRSLGASSFRIDLAVRSKINSDEYKLAICTDGKIYRSAKTTRDRERLRISVLKSLGWKVHRIWARDWVKNQKQELEKILQAI